MHYAIGQCRDSLEAIASVGLLSVPFLRH